MPITSTLTELNRIVDALGGLDGKTAGMQVRAADWNQLVAAVLGLARITTAREESDNARASQYATHDHDHTAQVTLDWLTPVTRDAVERGGPSALDLKQLEKRSVRLERRVDALEMEVKRLASKVDGSTIINFDFTRRLDRIERDFTGWDGIKTELDGVRGGLSELDRGLTTIDELTERLNDTHGDPIDFEWLLERTGRVDVLDEALTSGFGELIDYKHVEARLDEFDRRTRDLTAEALADFDTTPIVEAATRGATDALVDELEARDERLASLQREDQALINKIEALGALEPRLASVESSARTIPSLTEAQSRLETRADAFNTQLVTHSNTLTQLKALSLEVDTLRADEGALARRVDAHDITLDDHARFGPRLGGLEEHFAGDLSVVKRLKQLEHSDKATTMKLTSFDTRFDTLDLRVGRPIYVRPTGPFRP